MAAIICSFLLAFIAHGKANALGQYPSVDCKSHPQALYPFCNTALTFEQRTSDLVNRLNVSELIGQTSSIAPAIPRLGIRDYNWRTNCRHGWSASGGHWTSDLKWTVFPAPIGLGATFNPDLVTAVGTVTSDEGRALHNEMLATFNGSSTEAAAVNCFTAIVNLVRDPRWGRIQESFSEDPYLLSYQGAAYMQGLQAVNKTSKYLKISASVPMYVVHSGPDNIRAHFTATTSLHDLYDTYLEPFKSQVYGAGVTQIMAAYSGLNTSRSPQGQPDTANSFILHEVLRTQFEAANISVISDNGAIAEVYETHHFAKSPQEAAALCMNATTDLDLGHDEYYSTYLQKAIDERLVSLQTIKESVWRSFYLRMRLGDFDPVEMVPYQRYDKHYLNTQNSIDCNVMAAQQSIVLLKNVNGSLPLSIHDSKTIAVVGPNADAGTTQLSNYPGIPAEVVSILDGIRTKLGSGVQISYAKGCKDTACTDDSEFSQVMDVVKDSSVVVMVMGLDDSLEGESHDRVNVKCNGEEIDVLALPGCQGKLVSTVANMSKNVVIILMNGGPLSLGSDVYNNDNIGGILEVFYPGALGGTAVANVLFGEYNPGGRMPVTTYTSSKEVPDPTDYNMTTPPGRTYRYYTGIPEVPFGYGLSYTTFEYSLFHISKRDIEMCDNIFVSVMVTNTGKIAGDEVVQFYLSPPTIKDKPFLPKIQLIKFARRTLKAGEQSTMEFSISPYHLSFIDEDGERYVFPGVYTMTVAGSLPGKSIAAGEVKGLSSSFTIWRKEGPIKLSEWCAYPPKCIICDYND